MHVKLCYSAHPHTNTNPFTLMAGTSTERGFYIGSNVPGIRLWALSHYSTISRVVEGKANKMEFLNLLVGQSSVVTSPYHTATKMDLFCKKPMLALWLLIRRTAHFPQNI